MEALRVEFLGRKGRIARIMSRLPELEPAQRPLLGQTANRVKESLTAQFEAKKTALDNAEEAAALARFDAGLPGRLPWRGSLHPVTMVMEEICTIFKGLGYDIVSGPEVETDYYCLKLLNIPPEHPARDMQDTLYVSDGIVLRSIRPRFRCGPCSSRSLPSPWLRPDASTAATRTSRTRRCSIRWKV